MLHDANRQTLSTRREEKGRGMDDMLSCYILAQTQGREEQGAGNN